MIPAKWPAEVASTLNAAFGDKLGLEDQHALNGAPLFVPAVTNALTAHNGHRNEVADMVNGRDPGDAAELQRVVELTPWARAEFQACWERPPGLSDVELCRRLVVRSLQAIGAKRARSRNGWRARVDHVSPVDSWRRWPGEIPRFVDRLRDVMIEQRPASDLLALYDSQATAFFVDPPYLHATRSWDHRSIYEHEMSVADHAALLVQLQALQGMVLLAGYRSPMYDEALLPRGWQRVDVRARAQGNLPRIESMWLNPAALDAMRQPALTLGAS